jgi:hypothetical protein
MNTRIVTFANKTNVDLTGKEGYAVKFDTDGVACCSAITDQTVGIVTKGGTTSSEVAVAGEVLAVAGGTVTRGKFVIPHTDGTVKNTAASSQEFGLALEDGVAGDMVNVLVIGAAKTVGS